MISAESRGTANKSFISGINNAAAVLHRNVENFDTTNGLSYFQPKVGRSPKNRPAEAKSKIGEHLYKHHKMITEKHNKLKKDEELKLQEKRRQIHQNNKMSDKLVDQTKRAKLNDIFDVFDSDQDGIISASKIDLHTL